LVLLLIFIACSAKQEVNVSTLSKNYPRILFWKMDSIKSTGQELEEFQNILSASLKEVNIESRNLSEYKEIETEEDYLEESSPALRYRSPYKKNSFHKDEIENWEKALDIAAKNKFNWVLKGNFVLRNSDIYTNEPSQVWVFLELRSIESNSIYSIESALWEANLNNLQSYRSITRNLSQKIRQIIGESKNETIKI
jgi:hypothetical protein